MFIWTVLFLEQQSGSVISPVRLQAQVPANGSRDDQRLYTLNPVYGEEQAGYSHGNGSPVPAALAGFRQASGNPEADMPLNQAPLHDDAVQPPARQPRHATQANVSGQATQPVANGFGGGAARNVRAGHNYRSPLRQTSDPTTHRQAWDQGRPNGHLYQAGPPGYRGPHLKSDLFKFVEGGGDTACMLYLNQVNAMTKILFFPCWASLSKAAERYFVTPHVCSCLSLM